jgi:two-component system response regulator PilR (NtrC family)
MKEKILVVDDEQIIRESLAFVLKKEGYVVEEAANGREALEKHTKSPFDVIVTDIEMPEMRGIELLKRVMAQTPETFVLIITAFGSVETAIGALRQGAADYILKPVNFDDLLIRIKKLKEYKSLSNENSMLRQELQRTYDFESIVGQSEVMKRVFKLIARVAQTDGTVLITGRSGTGKELVARAIHFQGSRAKKRFVPVNCGAIVETLFESELFGHKKGSFTGATIDREGLFRFADGGTVFLDEVSEIPLNLQVKLLRALEQKEITPVGTTDVVNVDVRIIAATNRDLRKEVEAGKFREDLFYRLDVVEVYLPALAERRDDIPLLANHFLDYYKKQMNRRINGFSNESMAALVNYSWRGEVRELENAVERAAIFCDTELIQPNNLPEFIVGSQKSVGFVHTSGPASLKESVRIFEQQLVRQTLTAHAGDKEKAAHALGISLSSLYRKLEELEIKDEV